MAKAKSTPKKKAKKPVDLITLEDYEVAGVRPKTLHVLMSGKHSRRRADGKSSVFQIGQLVPDLSDKELAAFGDKFLTVDEFKARASSFADAKSSEKDRKAAAVRAEREASISRDAQGDDEAGSRAETIATMREEEEARRRVRF